MEYVLPNYYYVNLLNPYSNEMNMFYVELPEPPEPAPSPEFTLDDFLKHSREFEGYIGEGKTLNHLFEVFVILGRNMINYKLIGEDETTFKLLVSLFVGHHMQMAMGRLKNQADEISLTPEKNPDKKISYAVNMPSNELDALQKTNYGVAFWSLYMPYMRNRFRGIATNRGFKW